MTIAHAREAECEIEIALERDGTIRGIRGDIYVDIGAYVRPNGTTPVRNVAQFLAGPYRVPHLRLEAHAMVSNKTPTGTFRAPGRFEGSFFCERLLDLAAARPRPRPPRHSPPQSRSPRAEMPYRLPPIVPDDGLGGAHATAATTPSTFDRCIAEFGWHEQGAAARAADRGPLSRPRRRLLHRGRRLGPARACPHGDRGRRHGRGLCGLVGDRPGHRNHHGADRRRCAAPAAVAGQGAARLHHLSARGLWLLRLARDRHGRLRGDRCGEQSARGAARGRRGAVRRGGGQDIAARRRRAPRCRRPQPRLGGVRRHFRSKACSRARSRPTATARRRPMWRSIRAPGTSRSRLSRGRRCRPHRQSADAARPGDRRRRAGLRQRVRRAPRL